VEMRAMVLEKKGTPLRPARIPVPRPGPGEVLVRVHACAICSTDLPVVDRELPDPKLPLVPGHEIVGTVAEAGRGVTDPTLGRRVGIPWLAWTCREC
jgi:alcohol dehydrogenase, propanol-preferring